jgi:hypothetical protein
VWWFTEGVIELTFWAASWGAGAARINELRAVMSGADHLTSGDEAGTVLVLGAFGLSLWVGLVRAIATAFTYSFFWCLATAMYLLLRQDVDQTEFDEVFLEEGDEPYGLPPLKPDRHGVPLVPPSAETVPSSAAASQTSPQPEGSPATPQSSEEE